MIAIFRQHSHHVAVQIALGAFLESRNGDDEGDHAITVIGAKQMAADSGGDDEEADRQKLAVGKAPNVLLQLDRFDELVKL